MRGQVDIHDRACGTQRRSTVAWAAVETDAVVRGASHSIVIIANAGDWRRRCGRRSEFSHTVRPHTTMERSKLIVRAQQILWVYRRFLDRVVRSASGCERPQFRVSIVIDEIRTSLDAARSLWPRHPIPGATGCSLELFTRWLTTAGFHWDSNSNLRLTPSSRLRLDGSPTFQALLRTRGSRRWQQGRRRLPR
jgi:hypothetical protein